MKDPTTMAEEKEKPLTRKDVLRLIEENGGKAEGLDLSGKIFEQGIDLRRLDLRGIILMGAHLKRALLADAHLEGAILEGAHLERAYLRDAHLEGAALRDAHLEGAYLRDAEFSPETRLEQADWGNYKIGEEEKKDFYSVVSIYRRLKVWYTQKGYHDIAGEFFYRETEAKRKELIYFKRRFWYRFVLGWSRWIFGHGERWKRLCFGWIPAVVLLFTLCYFVGGAVWEWWAFWKSLYFSAVSFTALGYGNWAPQPTGWAKGVGAAEAIVGVFMMALLLVTFIRKWTR